MMQICWKVAFFLVLLKDQPDQPFFAGKFTCTSGRTWFLDKFSEIFFS